MNKTVKLKSVAPRLTRTIAVLVLGGKIFEDECNHQYALLDAYDYFNLPEDDVFEEKSCEYVRENIEELIEYTYLRSLENTLACFSVFDDKVLIAHCKENLYSNYDLMKKYADEKSLMMAYHLTDLKSDDIVMVEF